MSVGSEEFFQSNDEVDEKEAEHVVEDGVDDEEQRSVVVQR